MGANRSPESTYAKVVAKMKINNLGKSSPTVRGLNPTTHSPSVHSNTAVNTINPPVHPSTSVQAICPALPHIVPAEINSPISVRGKNKIQADIANKSKDARPKDKAQAATNYKS